MLDKFYLPKPKRTLSSSFISQQVLFAFASYNAGAARVRKLRKETAQRGMDPNIWFHNVEVLAAEKIGAETVTYVSNIYKYYVAYSLMLEAEVDRTQAIDKMKGERNITQ